MPKVSIEVPEGMTPDRLLGLLEEYEKRRASNKANREVRNKVIKDLMKAHPDEVETLKKKYTPRK